MAQLGSDVAGVFDVDATLSVATGLQALAESILRRVTTPRGSLIDAPTYGIDIRSFIGEAVTASRVEQELSEQVEEEEEVLSHHVTVTVDQRTSTMSIAIKAVASEGPFELTVEASELTLRAFFNGDLFVELPEVA